MTKNLSLWLSIASFVGVLILGIYILRTNQTGSEAAEPLIIRIEQVSSDIQALKRKLSEIEEIAEWNQYEISELEDELELLDMAVGDLESNVSYLEMEIQ